VIWGALGLLLAFYRNPLAAFAGAGQAKCILPSLGTKSREEYLRRCHPGRGLGTPLKRAKPLIGSHARLEQNACSASRALLSRPLPWVTRSNAGYLYLEVKCLAATRIKQSP